MTAVRRTRQARHTEFILAFQETVLTKVDGSDIVYF